LNVRAAALALFLALLYDLQHLPAAVARIDVCILHAHADLLAGVGAQQFLEQQMLDQHADEDAAVAAVFLLRRVEHGYEAQSSPEQMLHLHGGAARFALVVAGHGVVVEGDAVDYRDEQQRPVGPAFGLFDVGIVVDGEENVRHAVEAWEGFFEGERVGRLHEHEAHRGAQEDDGGFGVGFEVFALEVPGVVSTRSDPMERGGGCLTPARMRLPATR
jgi:hypothetical protein